MDMPFVTCLCPTFRRSKLLANSIACFAEQDYPENSRELLVVDDSGELLPHSVCGLSADGGGYEIKSICNRFGSITEKYNAMVEMRPQSDVFIVWEDDDIYLPWHISSIVRAMPMTGWVKPDEVFSLYTGTLLREPAAGRFHASLGVSSFLLRNVGGWPSTRRADFDQKFMSSLAEAGKTIAPDYKDHGMPSYIFRWNSTGQPHGQNFMRAPGCTTWWDEAGRRIPSEGKDIMVTPKMDDETRAIFKKFNLNTSF